MGIRTASAGTDRARTIIELICCARGPAGALSVTAADDADGADVNLGFRCGLATLPAPALAYRARREFVGPFLALRPRGYIAPATAAHRNAAGDFGRPPPA